MTKLPTKRTAKRPSKTEQKHSTLKMWQLHLAALHKAKMAKVKSDTDIDSIIESISNDSTSPSDKERSPRIYPFLP